MTFRWGIFGTGEVSAKFVTSLRHAKDAKAVYIASRKFQSANTFANQFGILKAVSGYSPPDVSENLDAVYIATPTQYHIRHAIPLIEKGIPVLIEKPFSFDSISASKITSLSLGKKVFCMEAMWTRFLPAVKYMLSVISSGEIGEICQVSGSFGIANAFNPNDSRFKMPSGGALNVYGVYPISLASMLLGKPVSVTAVASLSSTGVEENVSASIAYSSGAVANINASLTSNLENRFFVSGTRGSILLKGPIFRPHSLQISSFVPREKKALKAGLRFRLLESNLAHQVFQKLPTLLPTRSLRHVRQNYTGNGYHYQADEVAHCVKNGQHQSETMPLSESIMIAQTIDLIRERYKEH